MSTSSYLVKGGDGILVDQELRKLVHELLGDVDPAIGLEEVDLGLSTMEERAGAVGWLLDAMRTPPFLVERRVVVGKDVSALSADESRELVAALGEPTEGVFVVLSSSGGRLAPGIPKAVAKVLDVSVGKGKDKQSWWAGHLAKAPVQLDAKAGKLIQDNLGDDAGRLEGLLQVLASTYGEGASVTAAQVAPLLGSQGGIPTWELTDPIIAGNMSMALRALHRFGDPGYAYNTIRKFVLDLQAIDGGGVTTVEDVASVTTLRGFPAEKALQAARALGSDRIARGVQLVGQAELDARGGSGIGELAVLEVLVARLAQMASVGARR